jgi:hypothetical protein
MGKYNLEEMSDKNLCLICQTQIATTAEHINKRSDLKVAFSEVSFSAKNKDRLRKTTNDGKKIIVQGLKSEELKYEKNLCHPCQTTRSQPWDKAYEKLISFINDHYYEIHKQKFINLKLVYGNEVKSCQESLFRYFAKAFICCIDAARSKEKEEGDLDSNVQIPNTILDIVQQRNYGKEFFITVSINEELFERQEKSGLKDFVGSQI